MKHVPKAAAIPTNIRFESNQGGNQITSFSAVTDPTMPITASAIMELSNRSPTKRNHRYVIDNAR